MCGRIVWVPGKPRTSHTRPTRMRTSGMSIFMRLAVTVAALPTLLAGLSACRGTDAPSASCAAVLLYDGHTYLGGSPLKRDPKVTSRSMPPAVPGCDDTGGQSEAEKDEPVRVVELADVATTTAVLFHGSIYVREGRVLPAEVMDWFRAPRCGTAGTFEVTGDWLGVLGPKQARFDGDIRLPYRLEMHVRSGPPGLRRDDDHGAGHQGDRPSPDPGRREGVAVAGRASQCLTSVHEPALRGHRAGREMTPRDQAPRRNDPGRCHGSGYGSIAMSAKGCDMVEAARPDLPR